MLNIELELLLELSTILDGEHELAVAIVFLKLIKVIKVRVLDLLGFLKHDVLDRGLLLIALSHLLLRDIQQFDNWDWNRSFEFALNPAVVLGDEINLVLSLW